MWWVRKRQVIAAEVLSSVSLRSSTRLFPPGEKLSASSPPFFFVSFFPRVFSEFFFFFFGLINPRLPPSRDRLSSFFKLTRLCYLDSLVAFVSIRQKTAPEM